MWQHEFFLYVKTRLGLTKCIAPVNQLIVNQDHSKYTHKVFVLSSDCLTMSQIEEAHKRASGWVIPAILNPLASLLIRANGATQDL